MGQTLTHGIYLPDEGERNCYDGLAANWQILDTSVGTIAAHTAALAGKAPLVHTHTKADITDFPAYGTTAGTICEGNDSRLSDARTPVAHTHTKSDVTDLFNSANTWTGEQTFSQTIQGNTATASEFASNQSVTLTGTIEGTASSKAGWTIATDFREGRGARTTTDFYAKLASGSVSGGWNVYNAIFMCNSSERDGTCLIQLSLSVNNSGIIDSSAYARLKIRSITGLTKTRFVLVYKNDTNRVLFELYAYNPSANQAMLAKLLNEFIRNGNKQSINIQMHSGVVVNALPDDYTVINATDSPFSMDIFPLTDNAYNLGTSTNKWKTLNGLNPGALSLPDINTSIAVDTTNWVYDGATFNEIKINNATQTISGWLYIIINNASINDVIVVRYAGSDSDNLTYAQYKSGLSYVSLVSPIMPGVKTYVASRKAFSTIKIYHSLGNVV